MSDIFKPYLVIPKFVEQPTWGGTYISRMKKWDHKQALAGKKIGQSYELYGKSLLAADLTDSASPDFGPVFSAIDHVGIKFLSMPELINRDPEKILGKYVWETFKIMPVLIKFTQALGNSFQLHIKTGIDHPHWKPKPESWYYFEKGYLSYGLKKGTDIRQYQQVCTLIDRKMHDLSMEVINHRLSLADARNAAAAYIKSLNPQQFINVHHVDPNTLIDLSPGGIHHSWEEDPDSANGNVLYEVQLDTADDVSTMRSFDQGKFKDDGTVRNLTISDYFEYIDKSEALNDIENARCRKNGDQLLSTRWYAMDEIELTKVRQVQIRDSFEHLFVREGHISVSCEYGKIDLSTGHSCFIPWGVRNYQIDPIIGKAVVIKTYICGGNQ